MEIDSYISYSSICASFQIQTLSTYVGGAIATNLGLWNLSITFAHGKMLGQATWIQENFIENLCKKGCHQLPKRGRLKALVWFWIIDETLVLTSMLSVCRLNEVGTCQVMEQVMIMVMMVMTTRWSSAQLGKEEREKQNPMEIKAKVLLRVLVLVIKTP